MKLHRIKPLLPDELKLTSNKNGTFNNELSETTDKNRRERSAQNIEAIQTINV